MWHEHQYAGQVAEASRLTATTIDGQQATGETLAGKPIVLWFCPPWCAICRRESAGVASVARANADTVTFLGVAALSVPTALAALAVYGVGTSTGMVTYNSLLQAQVTDHTRGRVFAGFDMLWQTGRLASIGLIGLSTNDITSPSRRTVPVPIETESGRRHRPDPRHAATPGSRTRVPQPHQPSPPLEPSPTSTSEPANSRDLVNRRAW